MKTRKIIPLKFIGLLCFALNSSVILAQSIITIDNNSGSETTYQTLQDAHDNSVAGDTIYVQPSSVSYGSAILTKPITIVGRSHSEVGKQSITDGIKIGTSHVTLKGLYVDGIITTTVSSSETPNTPPFGNLNVNECYTDAFVIGNDTSSLPSPININNVQIRGNFCGSGGITVNSDINNVVITNNIILSAITVRNPSSTVFSKNVFRAIQPSSSSQFVIRNHDQINSLILVDNMFIFNSTASSPNIYVFTGHVHFENNLTYNYNWSDVLFWVNTYSNASFTENNTLTNTDPLFTDVNPNVANSFAGEDGYDPSVRLADDLKLQPGSPALTGGSNNSEIGLYFNYNYKNLGNPNGFPILDVLSHDPTVPKNGNINVTIQAKAN